LAIRREGERFVIERVGGRSAACQPPAGMSKHAAETAMALKGLGFKPSEIKEAMEKTRTHVGTDEKDLQQWITIALRYCPKGPTKQQASA
jgi:Holliday junction resolvasome RuvABC DNA-binding subunit